MISAGSMLGAHYFIYGKVVGGKSLGRTLDFPTINQEVAANKLLPKSGVYFTKTEIGGKLHDSITNVGTRPTFEGIGETVETFIFDYGNDAYGKQARVSFLNRHRAEMKFRSASELKSTIQNDVQMAKAFFKEMGCRNE